VKAFYTASTKYKQSPPILNKKVQFSVGVFETK